MNLFFRKNNSNLEKGFSLMELMVVIAILIILLSISLFNYDKFGKDVELENAVYSMALAIREAQVYGVNKALKEVSGSPENSFAGDYGYGVYFNKNGVDSDPANSKRFVLFIDSDTTSPPNNKIFNGDCGGSNDDECYSQVSLTKGNYISSIKFSDDGNSWFESDDGKADIYFKRPNPDATILNGDGTNQYSFIQIQINSPADTYSRCVRVGVSGDITISRTCY